MIGLVGAPYSSTQQFNSGWRANGGLERGLDPAEVKLVAFQRPCSAQVEGLTAFWALC